MAAVEGTGEEESKAGRVTHTTTEEDSCIEDKNKTVTTVSSLDVGCSGVLYKRSMKGDEWEKRHCILKSGIFCYFRTLSKLESFRDNAECLDSETPSEKRKAFRKALENHPPRGFIKLLNGLGKPVSRVQMKDHVFYVTHLESHRTFELKCDDQSSSLRWTQSFQKMGLMMDDNNNNDGDSIAQNDPNHHHSHRHSSNDDGQSSNKDHFINHSSELTSEAAMSEAASEMDEDKMRQLERDEERMRETADALKREAELSMSQFTHEFSQWLN